MSIAGINLKAVHFFPGEENTGFTANIYAQGKKLGTVTDSGWGGEYQYDFATDTKQKEFDDTILAYYKAHPSIDTFKLYDMNYEAVSKMTARELPKEVPDEDIRRDVFVSELLAAKEIRDFKKKIDKKYQSTGQNCVVAVRNQSIGDHPTPRDVYINGTPAACRREIEKMKKEGQCFVYSVFMKPEDFEITDNPWVESHQFDGI